MIKNLINKIYVFGVELFSSSTIITIYNDETLIEIITELKNIFVLVVVHLVSSGVQWLYKRVFKTAKK